MPLTPGTRLGPYEIDAALGAGGMGEVYKAHDTRLGRDVALKVLLSGTAADPDRLRRFEQEARATAALNHPNIVAVFDVGTDGGVSYVVTELLEGETLRDRLKGGPLSPRKVIEWGAHLGSGLSAAHEKGIVHRDLKPENLFLTRDGRIKILDFGIAKLADRGPASRHTDAPTADAGTTPGVVLGTVGYMSPEQVRGLPTDYRTDIFSFGAILYEMLSARRAFSGPTQADALSAILSADPAESGGATRQVPPILDRLVRRCLEKNPEERFQSARDVAFSLEALGLPGDDTVALAAIDGPGGRGQRRWPALAATLGLGLAIGGGVMWIAGARARPTTLAQFQQLTFRRGTMNSARFGPDGETIAYSAGWEGKPQELYSARIGVIGERPLGIQGELLSISTSGEMALLLNLRNLGRQMQVGTLARAPLGGGAPREILRDVGGADWSADGQQLIVTRFLPAERRWRLEYPIGMVIFETDKWIERPRLSPDGSRILLFEHPISGDNRGVVVLVTLKGERSVLTPEYTGVVGSAWSPSGDEAWFTASLEGSRLELLGVRPGGSVRRIAAVPASVVVDDTRADGRMLLHTRSEKARTLVKTPADTEEREISWFEYTVLRDLSADGRMVLFEEQGEGGGPNYSVFVRRTDGAPAVRLGDGSAISLSPDGEAVLTSIPTDPPNTFNIVPIGPGDARKVVVALQAADGLRWFPDGKRLALAGNAAGRPRRSYEYTIESGALRPLTPEGIVGTRLSPDGRTLIATGADGKRMLWPVGGGEPKEIRGLSPQDVVAGWTGDDGSLFVSATTAGRGRDLARLDLATGRRQVLAAFGPSDPAGVRNLSAPFVSTDGRTYAYRYSQTLSDLFVGRGLK